MIAVGAGKGKAGEPDEYKNQRPMAHLLSVVVRDAEDVEIVDYH